MERTTGGGGMVSDQRDLYDCKIRNAFVPWGNALLATTILFTLAERSSSSFFAATVIGVEMAVGVIDAIAVADAFGVFGVLAAAVAIAPLTIAADAATDVAAAIAVVVVVFGFFLIVLPSYRFDQSTSFRSQYQIFNHIKLSMVCECVCVRAHVR